ncbi:MAG TPA: hypothetical protein VGQ83_26025 [Polyangia bacterium]|jgi:hypothetical protein
MKKLVLGALLISIGAVNCLTFTSGGAAPQVAAYKPGTPQQVTGQGGLTGTWGFVTDGVDPETQARVQTSEEWVLGQTGDNLTGYYEVRTRFTSPNGAPYECSGVPHMNQAARYQIHGGVSSGMLRIFEDAVASSDNPCDRRQLAPGPSHAGRVISPAQIELDEGRRVLMRKQ